MSAPVYEIEVQVAPEYVALVSGEHLAEYARQALAQEGQPAETGVTLVLTTDEEIRALNRDYRATDSVTDVLSFALDEEADQGPAFVLPEGLPRYLGDIIVSYPTALAQAAEQGHSVEQELALLIVHGCLHLLGYDHAEEEQQAQMWQRQESILRGLKFEV
jgi:probable rRNA maturation factor